MRAGERATTSRNTSELIYVSLTHAGQRSTSVTLRSLGSTATEKTRLHIDFRCGAQPATFGFFM